MERRFLYIGAFLFLSLISTAASPDDPHVPQCYNVPSLPFIPKTYTSRPCAWFEGWYARIVDPTSGNSFAAIVGTINATGESMVTLLSCYSDSPNPPGEAKTCASGGDAGSCASEKETEKKADKAWEAVGGSSCGQLKLTEVIAKGAVVTTHGKPVVANPSPTSPPNFEWSIPKHGFIRVVDGVTTVDLNVGDVSFKANLTNPMGWKKGDPAASPEGWVGKTASFLLPCRWYIHSVGSEATYAFKNGTVAKEGKGWGHEEKNWGKMFPEGHVWAQAISKDNSVQVVLAIVYFKAFGITSPYVVSLGYRSPNLVQDFRNVDILTFVTKMKIEPCSGHINILVHTLSHSLRLVLTAPLDTFSPKLVAPNGDAQWQPLCQESFAATARVGVWQRNDTWGKRFSERLRHGPLGENIMIDRHDIHGAALEFGEGLLCENVALEELKKEEKMKKRTKRPPPLIEKSEDANLIEATSGEEKTIPEGSAEKDIGDAKLVAAGDEAVEKKTKESDAGRRPDRSEL